MGQVSVEDIQSDLPSYLQQVEVGKSLLIVRAGQPVPEIKSVLQESRSYVPLGYAQASLPCQRTLMRRYLRTS
jgi:antitoxin (DNA-binding transcriptional repressor) of toxin-antitoxin stability system